MDELEPSRFHVAEPLLSGFFADHLSVAAVLDGAAEGIVLVDDPAAPSLALLHGPEGSYLGGGLATAADPAGLREAIDDWAYLHISPDWVGPLGSVLPHAFMLEHSRLSFQVDTAPFRDPAPLPDGFDLERADAFGCRILSGGDEVSRCLPDMVVGTRTEIGVWTHPAFRRRGLALAAARTTLAQARAAGLTQAGWHCHASNRGSARLAMRLGGVPGRKSVAHSASLPAENGDDLDAAAWRRLGEHFDHAAGTIGWMAFHAAGAWAQAGERERALAAVELLVDGGWDGDADWLAGNWALADLSHEARFRNCLARLLKAAEA